MIANKLPNNFLFIYLFRDRGRRDGWSSSSMDKDEEDYFNDSDDDNENTDIVGSRYEQDNSDSESVSSTNSCKRPRSGSNEDLPADTAASLANLPKRPRSVASYDGENDDEENWFDAISHYDSPPPTSSVKDSTTSNTTEAEQ
ncbi:hypothetical protein BDF19DRAFT_96369 [Syncephalis fuscata]|nr:hypothetical protein BDF19DRAFT_96369 [Syncephalis fuscata]